MESNTAALMKILDSLEKQERMVKTMLEDRKKQLEGKGRPQPGLQQLTASAAQVQITQFPLPFLWQEALQHLGLLRLSGWASLSLVGAVMWNLHEQRKYHMRCDPPLQASEDIQSAAAKERLVKG